MNKKIIAVFVMVLLIATLVGCSQAELEYLKLSKEIEEIDFVEVEGEATLVYEREDTYFRGSYEENEEYEEIINRKEFDFRFNQKMCNTTLKSHTIIDIKKEGSYVPLTEIIFENGDIYIKIDSLLDQADMFLDDDGFYSIYIDEMKELIGDAKYIKLFDEEIQEFINYFQMGTFNTHFEGFKEVFEGLNTGAFSIDGDEVVIRLDMDNLIDVITNTANYMIDNIDEIEEGLESVFESMEDENGLIFDEILRELGYIAWEIRENEDMIRQELEFMKEEFDEVKEILGDSMFEYRIGKDNSTFNINTELIFDYEDYYDNIFIHFNANETIREISEFEIEFPDENEVITEEELEYLLFGSSSYSDYMYDEYPYDDFQQIPEPTEQSDEIIIFIDGLEKTFDPGPQIIEGRTMVPMRAFFESIGAEVGWEGSTQTAIGKRDGIKVEIPLDSQMATVNNQETPLDAPAQLIDGNTFIPLRFVGEAFGDEVIWHDGIIIIITDIY